MKRSKVRERQQRRHGDRKWSHEAHREVNERIRELTCPRPVARRNLEPGTIAWVDVPFVDEPNSKGRPVVVIDLVGRDVTVLPITSTSARRHFGDFYYEVEEWDEAGLSKPSAVQRRPHVLDAGRFTGVVGHLSETDLAGAQRLVARMQRSA